MGLYGSAPNHALPANSFRHLCLHESLKSHSVRRPETFPRTLDRDTLRTDWREDGSL